MDTSTGKHQTALYRGSAESFRQLASETEDRGYRLHLERLATECEAAARLLETGEETTADIAA